MEIQKTALPRQRQGIDYDVTKIPAPVEATVQAIRSDVAIVENGPVYALVGDAHKPDLQQRVKEIKGERGANQPLGWTVPFAHAADAIEVSAVKHDKLRDFIADPDALTRLLGGLVFLRAPASLYAKAERRIPDSIIPDRPDATVQIWSPTGNYAASRLIRAAMAHGIEPVMTSVNRSRSPEITSEHEARCFAARYIGERALIQVTRSDDEKPLRPRGSYPVVNLEAESLQIVRPGCFSVPFLQQLLAELPTQIAPGKNFQSPKHPEQVFDVAHLPRQAQRLEGEDLRLFTLEHIGLDR